MTAMVCSACGAAVGRYLMFGSLPYWMHEDGSDAAACANTRGDRPWEPVPADRKPA